MDKKGGWIKLYRSVWENWVYENPEDFRAWIDLLLMANHEDRDVKVNGVVYTIRRGQKLTSILKLSKRWKWTERKTLNFLKQLQNSDMIYYESSRRFGTLITLRNYDIFQGDSRTDDRTDGRTDAELMTEQNAYKQEYKNNKNDKEGKNNKERRPWGGRLEPE